MLRDIFEQDRRLAVLGYSDKPDRAGHYVPEYLAAHGYTIVGVNPMLAGRTVPPARGPVRASLAELNEPVDLVLMFRRSADVLAHVPEILALDPLPRTVWMQSGISNEEAARQLSERGIRVVQDRCMMVDHRHYA